MSLRPLLPLLLLLLSACSLGQRYAERNVPPSPVYQEDGDDDYEYEDDEYKEDLYGLFREEEEDSGDVYKWIPEQFPHPVNNPRFCNRMRASHVCDPDMVLQREQADQLDALIDNLYRGTPCICGNACADGDGGIVVGIALLKHLKHPYHMHHAKVVRSFAENLRARWNLGRCQNDILIVVATEDRLSYTDVGSATSRHLSIQEAHRIFLENKAKFSASNFSQGLTDILEGYRRATQSMRSPEGPSGDKLDMAVLAGAIVGAVLLLGLILFLGFVIYRKGPCWNRNKEVTEIKKTSRPNSTVSSSWSKKDIKVLFGPEKSGSGPAKYQKCGTDERDDPQRHLEDEEDEMDFTLATPHDVSFPQTTPPDPPATNDQTQLTNVTADSETLEKELTDATEGLVKTFPPSPRQNNGRNGGNVLVTDM